MFDLDHVKYSIEDIESVKGQVQEVLDGKLDYVTQFQGVGVIDKRTITGHYAVAETVTAEQIEQVALGIVMHFEQVVEANQDFTSVFSVEDLPSDYVGWYIGLNPGTSELTFLTQLNNGSKGEIVGVLEAQMYKYDMGQNFEPSPMKEPGVNVPWPPLLRMKSADENSGLWTELDVTVVD